MKKTFGLLFLTLVLLFGCQSNEKEAQKHPLDDLTAYIDAWEALDFTEMAQLIDIDETKTNVTDILSRYEEVYEQLGTDFVTVDITVEPDVVRDEEADDEEIDQADYTYTLSVTQNTLIGDYSFDIDVTLTPVIETVEDEALVTGYNILWHEGLIIPPLLLGGDIRQVKTEAIRGNIFDRNGEALAVNGEMREIGIDTGRFVNRATELEFISKALGMSVAQLEATLSQSWVQDGLFIPIKRVSVTEEDTLNQLNEIPSVLSMATYGRVYPEGEKMSHLIGHVGTVTEEDLENDEEGFYDVDDMIGKRGLEAAFEERLRGTDGLRLVVDSNGNRTGIIEQEPVDGENLHLTIDAAIQATIFDQFTAGDAGHAAAIDPHTGETLALVSYPSFDPTLFTEGMSQETYQALIDDPLTPLLNRFQSTYSPGSSFKPITLMIGLNTNTFTPSDTLEIDGYTYNQPSFGNYSVRRVSLSDGPVDLHDALVRSDNIYFARQALAIGAERFLETSQLLGFNNTDYTFSYPIRRSQIATDHAISNDVLLADTGYGQGEVLMSSHHLALSYTPLFNDGAMLKPRLLQSESTQTLSESIVSNDDITAIKAALKDVVHGERGTAKIAQNDTVTLSGKTGTAELKQSPTAQSQQENGWFVGYDEDETYLIALMVESVESKGGSRYPTEKVTNAFIDLFSQ